MGWSCSRDAGITMDAWSAACRAETKMSNVYHEGGKEYFWEASRKEHNDGAITGSVMVVVEKLPGDVTRCRKAGSFRINGDGTVARGPASLKRAAATVGKAAA